jgi:hypothetical protein
MVDCLTHTQNHIASVEFQKKNLLSRLVTLVIEAPSITGIFGYHAWSGFTGGGDNLQHSRPIKTYILQNLLQNLDSKSSGK